MLHRSLSVNILRRSPEASQVAIERVPCTSKSQLDESDHLAIRAQATNSVGIYDYSLTKSEQNVIWPNEVDNDSKEPNPRINEIPKLDFYPLVDKLLQNQRLEFTTHRTTN